MARIKEIRKRIKSVTATHKITRTMEMVAAGRMKRAMDRMVGARPFMAGFTEVVSALVAGGDLPDHPLLEVRSEVRREAVVVLSSNRGLCGAFNTNLFRRCLEEVRRIREDGREVEIHALGRKVASLLRFQGETVHHADELPDRPMFADAEKVALRLVDRFRAPEDDRVDRVTVVYATYQTALRQPPESIPVLPIRPVSAAGAAASRADATLYSPDREEILTSLLPVYLETLILQALLETTCSEQVARRNAMKNATDNAEEMVKSLTRTLNRARQAQITSELAEIVGGAEALK